MGAARLGRRDLLGAHPLYQWDASREPGVVTLRLFGRLGDEEFGRVLEALQARVRGPRDVVTLDFEGVEHVDFRAVAGFLSSLARWRDRGAAVWLVAVSPYIRQLMDVSGQGALRRSLSWDVGPSEDGTRFGQDSIRAAERRALRAGVWN
jgi:anti-anti-sigma regulatory factor